MNRETLQKLFNELQDNGQYEAKKNHRRNREIKAGVFFLYPDITRQAAYPLPFISEEINEQAGHHDNSPDEDHVFSGVFPHFSNLQRRKEE
jgi:hypothetical protein